MSKNGNEDNHIEEETDTGVDPGEDFSPETDEEEMEEEYSCHSLRPFRVLLILLLAGAAALAGFAVTEHRDQILAAVRGEEPESSESSTLVRTISPEEAAFAASQKAERVRAAQAKESAEKKEEAEGAGSVEESEPETPSADEVLEADDGTVTFAFAGDILFDTSYAAGATIAGLGITNCFDGQALSTMQNADVFVLNNEFPYTTSDGALEGKKYTFHADPSTVTNLDAIGCDLVTLANNHAYDYGEQGLLDTLDTLTADGMPYIGAGRNLAEASRPRTYAAGGVKIAILNATQIERYDNPETKGATDTEPGVFRCYDPANLYAAIRQAKADADLVFVYVHWGTEGETQPDALQVEQAQGMQEAGADLVIGDHPHVLQGFTSVNGMPVLYSLGNFLFHSKTQDTGILEVQVDTTEGNIQSISFVPMISSNCLVTTAEGDEKTRILNEMQQMSEGVTVDGDGSVTWQ